MSKLELVKSGMYKYVDLDVFEVGKLYYVVCKNDAGRKSAIATCMEKDEKHVNLKYIEKITGDWNLFENVLVVERDILSVKDVEIQPIELTHMIDQLNFKLYIKIELEL